MDTAVDERHFDSNCVHIKHWVALKMADLFTFEEV